MDLQKLLQSVGGVISVFNPVVGNVVMTASNLVKPIKDVDDDFLENKVIGLSGSANLLREMVGLNKVDNQKLLMIADNLDDLSIFLNKIQKIVK